MYSVGRPRPSMLSMREEERSRELATLNPHFKCFIVLHGALAEERKDRSREGYSGVITLVQARGG